MFEDMKKVLVNWQYLPEGSYLKSRKALIEEALAEGVEFWDHNVALVELFRELKAQTYLEIGVHTCSSLIHALRSPHVKHVVGVDTFDQNYAGSKFKGDLFEFARGIAAQHEGKETAIVKSKSQSYLEILNEHGKLGYFDVTLVDGDHSFKGAEADLEAVLSLTRCAIVFDDVNHPSHRYLAGVAYDFADKHGLQMKIDMAGNGCAVFYLNHKEEKEVIDYAETE